MHGLTLMKMMGTKKKKEKWSTCEDEKVSECVFSCLTKGVILGNICVVTWICMYT